MTACDFFFVTIATISPNIPESVDASVPREKEGKTATMAAMAGRKLRRAVSLQEPPTKVLEAMEEKKEVNLIK